MSNKSYHSFYAQSDDIIVGYICEFVKKTRIDEGMSQDDVALRAGISRSTLSLIERGNAPNLETLIKILRVLGRLDAFMEFRYEPVRSPIMVAEEEIKMRKRVRSSKKKNDPYTSNW